MQLLHDLRQVLATTHPAELGPEKREGTLTLKQIDALVKYPDLTPALRNLLRAAVYLWHDHLDPAHDIAQNIETADGSLLHAIMHRREPDYPNAKYWLRRAGNHPSFLALALNAERVLDRAGERDLRSRLLPNNTWDPFAFVDAVEDASAEQFRSRVPLLQELQRLEIEAFVENLVRRVEA